MTSGISISYQANAELPLSPRLGEAPCEGRGGNPCTAGTPRSSPSPQRHQQTDGLLQNGKTIIASSQTAENNVCAVCDSFPSAFINMKMRRFIRLSFKETRLHPGEAQCENTQYLIPIRMATRQSRQPLQFCIGI